MSLKLKALGLGVIVAIAMSALTTMSASANVGGHFTSDSPTGKTVVNQTSSPESTHALEVVIPGLSGIVCDEMTATGEAVGSTVTEPIGNLTVAKCHTKGGTPGELTFHINGCQARLTIAPGDPEKTEQTDDLICPAGKSIEATHPSCAMRVPPQNNISAFTYTTVIDNGKHAITVDVQAKYTLHFEAGPCVLLGTVKTAQIVGSTIVRGYESINGKPGSQVNITAT